MMPSMTLTDNNTPTNNKVHDLTFSYGTKTDIINILLLNKQKMFMPLVARMFYPKISLCPTRQKTRGFNAFRPFLDVVPNVVSRYNICLATERIPSINEN